MSGDRKPSGEPELVEFVRSIDVQAPARLHAEVQRLVGRAARERPRRFSLPAFLRPRPALLGAGVSLAAVLAAMLALALAPTGSGRSTLERAAALALEPPTGPAPRESRWRQRELTVREGAIAFPYWGDSVGWRATGVRRDTLEGRAATTVYYAARGAGEGAGELAYTIVADTPTRPSAGGRTVWLDGTRYTLRTIDQRHVVAWNRGGELCVVSSAHAPPRELLALARAS